MVPRAGSGLTAGSQIEILPGIVPGPGPMLDESARCLRWRKGTCSEVQGLDDTTVSMKPRRVPPTLGVVPARPDRTAHIETVFGPARWRREVAAFTRDMKPRQVRVHGVEAQYLPASGQSGGDAFLQWEAAGVNIAVFGPGSDFTEAELITVAEGLHLQSVTVPIRSRSRR